PLLARLIKSSAPAQAQEPDRFKADHVFTFSSSPKAAVRRSRAASSRELVDRPERQLTGCRLRDFSLAPLMCAPLCRPVCITNHANWGGFSATVNLRWLLGQRTNM